VSTSTVTKWILIKIGVLLRFWKSSVLIWGKEGEELELFPEEWPDVGGLGRQLLEERHQLHQLVVSRVHEPEKSYRRG